MRICQKLRQRFVLNSTKNMDRSGIVLLLILVMTTMYADGRSRRQKITTSIFLWMKKNEFACSNRPPLQLNSWRRIRIPCQTVETIAKQLWQSLLWLSYFISMRTFIIYFISVTWNKHKQLRNRELWINIWESGFGSGNEVSIASGFKSGFGFTFGNRPGLLSSFQNFPPMDTALVDVVKSNGCNHFSEIMKTPIN